MLQSPVGQWRYDANHPPQSTVSSFFGALTDLRESLGGPKSYSLQSGRPPAKDAAESREKQRIPAVKRGNVLVPGKWRALWYRKWGLLAFNFRIVCCVAHQLPPNRRAMLKTLRQGRAYCRGGTLQTGIDVQFLLGIGKDNTNDEKEHQHWSVLKAL